MVSLLKKNKSWTRVVLIFATLAPSLAGSGELTENYGEVPEILGDFVLQAGDSSLAGWRLPPPSQLQTSLQSKIDIKKSELLVSVGRALFFDKKLSADHSRSCASCHRPELGWSDGLPTATGLSGAPLARATPSLFNAVYGTIFMWDGRASSLEEQALWPVFDPNEMGTDPEALIPRLRDDAFYRRTFAELFPEQLINETTVATALAAFERTLVVRNTRFDQWVAGDTEALTSAEVRGFGVFLDPNRGSCSTCHAPPNFTDDGFHNIGLRSFANEEPDLGRYNIRPVKLMRGAFKTPSLRNVALTAPYFHDGSAQTLEEVVEHYVQGGEVKDNLSPEMKESKLNEQEKRDLLAFLRSLSDGPNKSQMSSIDLATD